MKIAACSLRSFDASTLRVSVTIGRRRKRNSFSSHQRDKVDHIPTGRTRQTRQLVQSVCGLCSPPTVCQGFKPTTVSQEGLWRLVTGTPNSSESRLLLLPDSWLELIIVPALTPCRVGDPNPGCPRCHPVRSSSFTRRQDNIIPNIHSLSLKWKNLTRMTSLSPAEPSWSAVPRPP